MGPIITIVAVIFIIISVVSPIFEVAVFKKYKGDLRKEAIRQIENKGYDYDEHYKNYVNQLFDRMRDSKERDIEINFDSDLSISIPFSIVSMLFTGAVLLFSIDILVICLMFPLFFSFSQLCMSGKYLPYIFGDYTKGLGRNYHTLTKKFKENIDSICHSLEKEGIITKSAETIRMEELKKVEAEAQENLAKLMNKYDKIDEPKKEELDPTESIDEDSMENIKYEYKKLLKQNKELRGMLEELKKEKVEEENFLELMKCDEVIPGDESKNNVRNNKKVYRFHYLYFNAELFRDIGVCGAFMIPDNFCEEEAFKVISYFFDHTPYETGEYHCCSATTAKLNSIGFEEVDNPQNDKYTVVDLFSVICGDTSGEKMFEKSKYYKKYFEWYHPSVTRDEVESIYMKNNMDSPFPKQKKL